MNSVTAVFSPHGVEALARQIASAIDTNHDGQISTGEFEAFLSQILGALSTAIRNDTGSAAASGSVALGRDPVPLDAEISPSQWIGDNAPYGVTFAGFSPQDHTSLSLADLKDPRNAKYAAYDYLLSNRIDPNGTWAQAAADTLNQQAGSTLFKAIDGETLGYGDEFIHSAPNGYGMQGGTYTRSAVGEFFWGSTNG